MDKGTNAYLAYANGDRNVIELFIKGYQEPGIHSGHQEVEHPVVFIENN
jgi:hypothetical protein